MYNHKGQRIIIGGFSPHIYSLPKELLETGPIIGINQWPEFHRCDYWIGLDTGQNWEKFALDTVPEYDKHQKFLPGLDCPKFMRTPNPDTEQFVPADAGIFFDKAPFDKPLNTEWNGLLVGQHSTALAAIHLAIVMGAAEVVLFGVDFVGDSRADGRDYQEEFWQAHKEGINNYIRRFMQHTNIIKLHPESWLECPYMEAETLCQKLVA